MTPPGTSPSVTSAFQNSTTGGPAPKPSFEPLIRKALEYFNVAEDPYEAINWVTSQVTLKNYTTGEVIFDRACEFPEFYSDKARKIIASKYFKEIDEVPEHSLKQLVHRVMNQIANWAYECGYLENKKLRNQYYRLMAHLALNQYFAFNSPVWFNGGRFEKPQMSACFINSVEDSMESILNLMYVEGMLFKGGSGTGTNYSKLRGSMEKVKGGGIASGPLSFIKALDASAGAIKSGGATRRAARMVILNDNHPDIEEFISCKVNEENKAKALEAAGFSGGIDGESHATVAFQNGNNSVRCTDSFMNSVVNDREHNLMGVHEQRIIKTVKAKHLFRQIAQSTWECGDPGVQFHDTIQSWHTCANTAPINASNPCAEFVFLDDTSCNLSSINLMKFLDVNRRQFDANGFDIACRVITIAQEAIVDRASYPRPEIERNSHKFRPLGLGYTSIGDLLMSMGLAYDSTEGRALNASITSLMTAAAYATSAEMAGINGAFEGYEENREPMSRVINKHALYANVLGWGDEETVSVKLTPEEKTQLTHFNEITWLSEIKRPIAKHILDIARFSATSWERVLELGSVYGYRNSQVTVLAPTGTISFFMDAETTGIEPVLALTTFKALVGGGTIAATYRGVKQALKSLGYNESQIEEIDKYIRERGHAEGAPFLGENEKVFLTSFKAPGAKKSLSWRSHVDMMASSQPFLSGAISKTCNMDSEATVEEIEEAYLYAWKAGIKCHAIYRDGSKGVQVLTTKKEEKKEAKLEVAAWPPKKRKLSSERDATIHRFEVGGHVGYLTIGLYDDGAPGEIFIKMTKEGSMLSGLLDAVAISTSVALQYGASIDDIATKHVHTRFEPSGWTKNPNIPQAKSLTDYIFKYLVLKFGKEDTKSMMGFVNRDEAKNETIQPVNGKNHYRVNLGDTGICSSCKGITVRRGTCHVCESCGTTGGCG